MNAPKPEFSHPVRVNEIGKAGLEFTIEADDATREAVAARLGVERVDLLKADITVKRWRRTGARMIAEVEARMTRRCVVSLEEFVVPVHEQFETRYADPSDDIAMVPSEGELVLDPESDEPPEILEGGSFDAGEAVVQFLILGLDPYPRKPGVAFAEIAENPQKTSPFAVLSRLKEGQKHEES